jgi:hypothetical protein
MLTFIHAEPFNARKTAVAFDPFGKGSYDRRAGATPAARLVTRGLMRLSAWRDSTSSGGVISTFDLTGDTRREEMEETGAIAWQIGSGEKPLNPLGESFRRSRPPG